MSDTTAISWCDATFNPWWGCAKVSHACDHCYAERDSKRFAAGMVLWGVDAERRTFGDKHWDAPLRWNATARQAGKRTRVFCASMADVFDKNAPEGARERLWALIEATPHLDWLLLTKRIGNVARMIPDRWAQKLPDNIWLGSTMIDQEEFDRDAPKLIAIPARVRFLSIEPMLGPIDMGGELPIERNRDGSWRFKTKFGEVPLIHWIIAGGESGSQARPMSIQWIRALRDQCAAAGVPFHFKQWGEWAPAGLHRAEEPGRFVFGDYEHDPARFVETNHYPRQFTMFGARCVLSRVGKKVAGRLLDGIQHNAFP